MPSCSYVKMSYAYSAISNKHCCHHHHYCYHHYHYSFTQTHSHISHFCYLIFSIRLTMSASHIINVHHNSSRAKQKKKENSLEPHINLHTCHMHCTVVTFELEWIDRCCCFVSFLSENHENIDKNQCSSNPRHENVWKIIKIQQLKTFRKSFLLLQRMKNASSGLKNKFK